MWKEKGGLSSEITLFAHKQSDFKKGMKIRTFRCLQLLQTTWLLGENPLRCTT
jgi:hypothetical protein